MKQWKEQLLNDLANDIQERKDKLTQQEQADWDQILKVAKLETAHEMIQFAFESDDE